MWQWSAERALRPSRRPSREPSRARGVLGFFSWDAADGIVAGSWDWVAGSWDCPPNRDADRPGASTPTGKLGSPAEPGRGPSRGVHADAGGRDRPAGSWD